MRCLVTGAGGFVGRHIVEALAAVGHEVVGLVHRTWPAGLSQYRNVSWASIDLAGSAQFPEGPLDAVIHCAAAIPAAAPNDAELYRINVEGTERVFAHARHAGASRVIFCSSMAAFGEIDTDIVDPETAIRSPGAYGRSKLAGEECLAALCAERRDIAGLSLRLPGVVGAGSHHNFLSDVMARLLDGHPAIARNPDALFNNVVHVYDLTGFVVDLLGSLPAGHRRSTIAADEPLLIREVVSLLAARAGRAVDVRFEVGGRPFLISTESARRLGYRVPTVRHSVARFARDAAAVHSEAGPQRV